jgi:hypothetical protein
MPNVDIYAVNDVTASMSASDMASLKGALHAFVDLLDLDPASQTGPQLAIGRFIGERCMRKAADNVAGRSWDQSRGSPTDPTKWYAYSHWQTQTDWCNTAVPPNLTGALPSFGTAGTNRPPKPTTPFWSPYYPGSYTVAQLGQNPVAAHNAVNVIEGNAAPLVDSACTDAGAGAPPSLLPYRQCDRAGTSHTAGIATAMMELSSSRAHAAPTRKVMILETDGVVCTVSTPFTPAQSQNRAIALAEQAKAVGGMEIFVVMFWQDNGVQTCGNNATDDSLGSLFPNCPDATSLEEAGPRTEVDDYLIAISSSSPNRCDHYFPWSKAEGVNLGQVYADVLARIAAPRARDGRSIFDETPAVRVMFSAVWGDRDQDHWVVEHGAELDRSAPTPTR